MNTYLLESIKPIGLLGTVHMAIEQLGVITILQLMIPVGLK